jgi:glutamyl-tRNA synthetase
MPLLRNPDKSKISKRKNPAARLLWFKEQGYLPEALRNFLQLMGYPPAADETEVVSFDQFVADFDWAKISPVGPVFDVKKLDWLNGHYIRSLSSDELADRVIAYIDAYQSGDVPGGTGLNQADREVIRQATPLIAPRLTLLSEALDKVRFLLVPDADLVIDPVALAKVAAEAPVVLSAAVEALADLPDFTTEATHQALTERLVDQLGYKPRIGFAPIRVAITGVLVSPPLFESMEILGRQSSLARLRALADLAQGPPSV